MFYEGEMGLRNYGNIFKDLRAGLGLQVQRNLGEASSQVGKLSAINRCESSFDSYQNHAREF
jgi:hypothetical protein